MKTYIRLLIIFVIGLLSFYEANATHIVGGNITYECLGNNRYKFTLTIRRDCEFGQEPFDPNVHLTIYNGEGGHMITLGRNGYVPMRFLGVVPIDSDLDGGCIDQGNPVCVEEGTYVGEAYLPPSETSGYILSYQRCCRNWTLNNIELPLEAGTTYFAEISPESLTRCNSTPVFMQWPPIYICAGLPLSFDHSASDAEGDSLVYSLCTPYQGLSFNHPQDLKADPPPYEPVVWKVPYGLGNLLGGVPLQIDPATGILTATPNTIGQFLVGICVKEYRNGVLIGTTYRDFEFNVRACGEKPTADFGRTTDPCEGLTQSFLNKSQNAQNYEWFFDADGDRSKTSTDENPTFTFDSAGTYKVILKVEKDGCADSAVQIIDVIDPDINVDFDYTLLCGDTLGLRLESTTTSSDSIIGWSWKVNDPKGEYTGDGNPVLILMEKGVQVQIQLEVEDVNGCKESKQIEAYLPNIDIEWLGDSLELCQGDSTQLFKRSRAHYKYEWSPTAGLDLTHPGNPVASPVQSTTYYVTITNDTCTLVDSIHLAVKNRIPVTLTGTDTTCDGRVELIAQSTGTTQFEWSYDMGFGDIVGTGDTLRVEITQDTVLFVRAGTTDDCQGVAAKKIIFGGQNVNIPREQTICLERGQTQVEVFLNPGGDTSLTYIWRPGQYLDDSTAANPKATVSSSVVFNVQVYDAEFPNCENEYDVSVRVGEAFEVRNLPVDTALCGTDSLRLNVEVAPEGGILSWCDGAGDIIGQGSPLVFIPEDSSYYVLKVMDTLGCVTRDSIFVRAYDKDFDIDYPSDLCSGDSVMMQLINRGEDVQIEWDLGENMTFIDNKVTVRPTTEKNQYKVTVRYGDGCVYQEDIVLTVNGFDDGAVVASADPTQVVMGRLTQLDVTPKGHTYMWTPADLLDDANSSTPLATINETGEYIFKVIVTDQFGCMGMDTVLVRGIPLDCEKGVFLPNAFTPNDDGVNDVLYVRSAIIQSMELIIYDRWGEEVFRSSDQMTGWDGTYQGTVLVPDIYNYILKYTCINGEKYSRIGNVSIIQH